MAEEDKIKQSRIIYVEPNDVYGYGSDGSGLNQVELTPDYSDMCIAFNLIVEITPRFKTGLTSGTATSQSDKKTVILSWISDGKENNRPKASFLDGEIETKNGNYLTTYYTEISYDGYKKKEMLEGLGVENIQVSFESWFTPTVTIKFVDVRGSALFGREEAIHDENGITSDNIFGAFFTFPYPVFRLQVKGFFGKPVTYQLTCSGFKSNFNATTGNFEATATFIGYTWSLLTDIPFSYLVAAPYCTYVGASYWNERSQSEAWRLSDGSQPPKLYDTFQEIRTAIYNFNDTVSDSDDLNSTMSSAKNEQDLLNGINSSINEFISLTQEQKTINITYSGFSADKLKETYQNILRKIETYNNSFPEHKIDNSALGADCGRVEYQDINEFTNTLMNDFNQTISTISPYGINLNQNNFNLQGNKNFSFNVGSNYKNPIDMSFENMLKKDNKLSFSDNTINNFMNQKLTVYIVTVDYNAIKKVREDVLNKLDDAKQRVSDVESEILNTKLDDIILNLGFKPYIADFFKIIMCHLETLCHIMFEADKEIRAQEDERSAQNMGVNINSTDVPGNNSLMRLPSWVAIYGKNEDINSINEDENTYKWCGDINHKFVEEKVILALQNAIQHTQPNQNDRKNTADNDASFPLLPSDVEIGRSPFYNSTQIGYSGLSGYLGIRAAQLFGLFDTTINSNNTSLIEEFGKMDAYNYYMTTVSISDVNNQLGDKKSDTIMGITCCDETYDDLGQTNSQTEITTHPFEFKRTTVYPETNGRQPIFLKKDGKYEYVYLYDLWDNKLIKLLPTHLYPYSQMKEYIEPYTVDNNVYFRGTENKHNIKYSLSNNWLCNYDLNDRNEKIIQNKDLFSINDKSNWINALINKYNTLKNGSIKVKDYDSDDTFNNVLEKYWFIDNEYYVNLYPSDKFITPLFETLKINKKNLITSSEDKNKKMLPTDEWFGEKSEYKTSIKEYNKFEFGNGKEYELNDLFVKTIDIFDSECNNIGSLYGNPFYYMQNQGDDVELKTKRKAFLFLQSLPSFNVSSSQNLFIKNYGGFEIINKSNLLYIGGLLWRSSCDNDPICYTEGSLNYKCANKDGKIYTMHLYNEDDKTKKLQIITDINSNYDYNITIDDYIKSNSSMSNWKLDDNVKTQLIEYFNEFAKNVYPRIMSSLELKYNDFGTIRDFTGEEFQNKITEINEILSVNKEISPLNIEIMEIKNFIGNYVALNIENNHLHLLMNEKNKELQDLIKGVHYDRVIISSNSALYCYSNKNGNIVIDGGVYRNYLNSFINTLVKIYNEKVQPSEEYDPSGLSQGMDVKRDTCLSMYLYLKHLWDKWLQGAEEDQFDVDVFFKDFIFIDSFYRKIGNAFPLNCEKLLECYEGRAENGSLFAYIGDIVSNHNCLFVPLPDYIGFGGNVQEDIDTMKSVFKPISYSKIEKPSNNNKFVVIYTAPPANQVPTNNEYRNDSFDIWNYDLVPSIFKTDSLERQGETVNDVTLMGYNIPSFGVAFAKQSNHLFKNISVDMNNPMDTSESIKSMWNIAQKANGKERKVCFYGQDIYTVYSNYSYSCTVDMMGNAQIQPLMYFQLLNVPLWKGTYMIYKVTHTMTPGNMNTTFTGMKMSKHPLPFASSFFSKVPMQSDKHDSSVITSGTYTNSDSSYITLENDYAKVEMPSNNWLAENHTNCDSIANKYNNTDSWDSLDNSAKANRMFNMLFEEISKLPENTPTPTWNIYATSGYRSDGKDHSTGGTLDLHIQRYDSNGKRKEICQGDSSKQTSSSQPELIKVIHIIRNNHMKQFNQGRVALEYPNPTGYLTNNTYFCMLHMAVVSQQEFQNSGFCIWRVDHGTDKNGKKVYGTSIRNCLNKSEYLNNIPLAIKNIAKQDFYNGSNFTKIWNLYIGFKDDMLREHFGSIGSADGRSIFQINPKYDFNAVCQPQGNFEYTFDNIKSCVLYFVAHGEGGNRNPSGSHSTDYCGINEGNKSFYNSSRTPVLNSTPQDGFVAKYDNDVFNFYFNNYYINYKDFLTNCRNPYCRYAGLLCLKGGTGFANSVWKIALNTYDIASCEFYNINEASKTALSSNEAFTQYLADEFFNKLFDKYPSYNGGKENTISRFKNLNKIY